MKTYPTGFDGPYTPRVMLRDPIFLRHRDDVWPFFWPVLAIAALWFRAVADRLVAEGCVCVDYEVSAYGLIRITGTVRARAPAGWKDELYAATGAYGAAGAALGTAPPRPGPAPEPGPEAIDALNIVYLRRSTPLPAAQAGASGRTGRAACLLAGLPLPAT